MSKERLPALLLDDAPPNDGVVSDKPFTGFDGNPATAECGYVVKGRLLAVRGTKEETLYGKLQDKVITRTDGDWIASWWVDMDDPLGHVKREFGLADTTSIQAEAVQIDDAELLGTSGRAPGKPGTLTSTHWSAGVTGGLVASVLGVPVPLQPDQIKRDGDVVTFEEQGQGDGSRAGHSLKIRWKYTERDTGTQRIDQGLDLKASVALLMDEVADSAWEAGRPLWIRTANGFIRWHSKEKDCLSKEKDNLSYRATSESRSVDVTSWLPAIPSGGFARLLLDASGDKILTVTASSQTAELTIQDPALMIAVPRSCCNGRDLAVALLPPDDASVTGTLCVVSRALAPSDRFCTATLGLTTIDASISPQLVLTVDQPESATQYFAPANNWVRLAESAANCAAGLARARVLLPHKVESRKFKLVLGRDIAADNVGELDKEAATSVALPVVDGKARSVSGPLAKFDISSDGPVDYHSEIWPPSLESEMSEEPAVLRGLYRRSSAQGSFAADELPPYTATQVVATEVATPTLPRLLLKNADTRWHYQRVAPDKETAQLRFLQRTLRERRGWVEGLNFLGRPDNMTGPIDYLELEGATKHVRNWLRLSNDTLVSRDATVSAAGTPDPTTPQYYEGQGQAIEPLVTKLGERDKPEERGSLSLFILRETLSNADGSSSFVLELIGQEAPVRLNLESFKDPVPVVNRLVIAVANPKLGETSEEQDAGRKPKQLKDPCRLALTTLNRLYLELEREAGHFVVRRGMVGWSASGAFGLLADANVGLEVTEIFERKGGALSRTVEFNGALSVAKAVPPAKDVDPLNYAYSLTAYFWAATWKLSVDASASTLRVIGYHGWTYEKKTKWFASMQDARVAGGRLDLSADFAVMEAKTASAVDSRGTDSPWQAVRRHLYSVAVDTSSRAGSQRTNKIAGFLKLRHAAEQRFRFVEDSEVRDLRLIPDWQATERDIVPLFSDLPRPSRPERMTWLRPQETQGYRLNTGMKEGSPGEYLDVEFHAFARDVQPGTGSELFACSLVGEIGREDGIPRWVPAPLRGGDTPPAKHPEAPAGAPSSAAYRLWLFDGPPRMVAEWAEGSTALHTPEEEARRTLARLGWTREAVLEADRGHGPEAVTWTVVDSPFLNREASIGWFAWPLRALGDKDSLAEWPQDVLPRTRQVPQYEAKAPRAFSIEVAFKDDMPHAGTSATRAPILLDLESSVTGEVAVPVKLRSAGLRAGAWYRLVDYDENDIRSAMFSPAALPKWGNEGKLITDPPGLFRWDQHTVSVLGVVPPKAGVVPEDVYLLLVPTEASGVKVVQSDEDLVIWDQDVQGQKVDLTRLYKPLEDAATPGAKRIGIRMPLGKPFRMLLVEFCTGTEDDPVVLQRHKYFDGGAERLAGLFDGKGQLQAFGTEQVSFYPKIIPDASEAIKWTRFSEWQYLGKADDTVTGWYVATVDIEGRVTLYR